MRTILYYSSFLFIIILSFFFYSSNFYTLLTSDDAVQVLMIHYFRLPHDLYFWGQDRYGSFIPFMGQIFHRGFGFSALLSESVTHYLLLTAGYFAFATFFRSNYSKLILAIVWFFPPIRLVDFLRMNIGEAYSLLAIGIFLLNWLGQHKTGKYSLGQHLVLLSVTFLFIIATWVSDLALISVFLILGLRVYAGKIPGGIQEDASFRWRPGIYYFVSGLILGAVFIFYGKYYADKSPSYNSFNDFDTILESVAILGGSLSELLLFRAYEPFTGVYLYLVILLSATLFVLRDKIQFSGNQKKWFLFFVLDFALILFAILASKWSFLNGVPRRYFSGHYLAFWMAFLLAFECLSESAIKKTLRILMLCTVVIAGAGGLYNLNCIWPKTLKPRAEYAREFESLGRIGIIGNYWNSYINSVTDPDLIIATPNDRSSVRNREMAIDVLKRDTIYIIRDGWLDSFPDSLNQFATPLFKNGKEFRMGDCFVCRYRK